MDLQELNNLIHNATKTELVSNLTAWKAQIKSILQSGTAEDETYFISHTGRELFRKLYNFELESEIKDDYDSGFQPISATRFNPKSINTVAWYDASDMDTIVKKEEVITEWKDKSSKENHLNADNKSATNNHTLIENHLNSRSVISLDGDDFFVKEDPLLPTPSGDVQVFVVANITTVNNFQDAIFSLNHDTAASGSPDFQIESGHNKQFRVRVKTTNTEGGNTNNYAGKDGVADQAGEWHIFSAIFNYSSSQTFDAHLDGIAVGRTAQPYSNKITGATTSEPVQLRLFSNRQKGQFPVGSIAEVIYCENSSSDTKEKIEAYLAYKWGLVSELDSAHSYKDLAYKSFNP